MTKSTILFALFILLSVTSCVKDYDPGFSEHTSKLVINSVFSTDSTIVVGVSQSKSIVDNSDLSTISDVKVELFEGEQKIEDLQLISYSDTSYVYTPFGEEDEQITDYHLYQSTVRPKANQSYSIQASKEGFETVSANSEVPAELTDVSITPNLSETVGEYYESFLRGNIYVDINDNPNEQNFYEILLFTLQEDSIFEYNFEDETFLFTGEVINSRYKQYVSVSDGNGSNSLNDEFDLAPRPSHFTDVTFNGKNKRFVINDVTLYLGENFGSTFSVEVEIRSISEEYYNYFTSYEKQSYTQGNFLAEPVIVYNNIENGYGIFAGYSTTIFPIDLE